MILNHTIYFVEQYFIFYNQVNEILFSILRQYFIDRDYFIAITGEKNFDLFIYYEYCYSRSFQIIDENVLFFLSILSLQDES